MTKKTIIIAAIVLTLLLMALVGYYFIIQTNDPTTGTTKTGFKSFFPFGGNDTPEVATQPVSTTTNTQSGEQNPNTNFSKKLRKLSNEEVSGAGTMDSKPGTTVRYIERATGHIYEIELFSPRQARISNTTIPLVYDAIWGNRNDSLMTRYLKEDDVTVETYSLSLKNLSTTSENTISGNIFPSNINDVSVFGNSVFYLIQREGVSNGYVSDFAGNNKKLIWNSDIKELNSQYVNSSIVALTTKPAPGVMGYLYTVNTGTGGVKQLIGNIPGLSTLINPDATKVLYLKETDRAEMFIFDVKSNTSTAVTPSTFPEKCIWSKLNKDIVYCAVSKNYIDGNSLTSWYRGFASFSDDIWKYDLKTNTSSILENLSDDSGESIDLIKPVLSDNEQYLVFMNKIDNTLWSLDLIQASIQP